MSFPTITDLENGFHTESGNIFGWHTVKQTWLPIECYLAAVPTQYGCKTYEEQFYKLTGQLGKSHLHPLRYKYPPYFLELVDGKMQATRKKEHC